MKGNAYFFDRKAEKDTVTGMEVIRLTDNKGNYDRPYFTTPQFTADNKFTIFVSDFTHTSIVKNPFAPAIGKIGFGELFLLELETGKVLQVTQGEAIKMGHGAHAMLAPDGKSAYYYSNEQLKTVDLETLESRELMWIPFTYHFHSLSMTNDGRYLAFSLVEEVQLLTERFANPLAESAPGARERFFKKPGSLVIRYDMHLGVGEVVYGGHYRITHTSLKPDDGDYLLYCHDGPWHLVQRMWVARVSSDEVTPLILQQHNLEGVVHEFFTPSGRVGAQYSYRYKPDMPFFMFADIYVDINGNNQERYYYPFQRPGHVGINPAETMGVGDCAMLSADMKDSQRYLSLIEYNHADHRAEMALLCAHDTSGKKSAHVHPSFTADGNHIVFSSDKEGALNIYMVEANIAKAVRKV